MRRKCRGCSRVMMIAGAGFLFLQSTSSSFESVHLKALQEQQQSFDQGQQALQYQSRLSQNADFCWKPQRQLLSKNYATHSLLGIKNSWIGKKFINDDKKSPWIGTNTSLEKKVFPTSLFRNISNFRVDKTTTLATSSYLTKIFYPEAKAQGGLEHDFQKALQEKKPPEEVRAMLEKEIQ